MTTQNEHFSLHWIMGAVLLLMVISISGLLILMNSQADTVSTSVTISNASPTVVDVYVTTGSNFAQSDNTGGNGGAIDLVSGGTKSIKVTGTVEDANGSGDISSVSLVLYHSSVTSACSADNNTCYVVSSCSTQAGSTSEQLDFNCPLSLAFYTNSTVTGGPDAAQDWIVKVTATDAANATGSDSSLHKEINTLLSLSIPSTLSFGSLANGVSTDASNNQAMSIEQYGNDEADVEVSMADGMTCDVTGTISRSNIKWALTDVAYGSGSANAMTTTATDTDLNVTYRTNDSTALTQNLYWNISIPSGVSGSCTGSMTITAIAH